MHGLAKGKAQYYKWELFMVNSGTKTLGCCMTISSPLPHICILDREKHQWIVINKVIRLWAETCQAAAVKGDNLPKAISPDSCWSDAFWILSLIP